jgi:hypothetical protein
MSRRPASRRTLEGNLLNQVFGCASHRTHHIGRELPYVDSLGCEGREVDRVLVVNSA